MFLSNTIWKRTQFEIQTKFLFYECRKKKHADFKGYVPSSALQRKFLILNVGLTETLSHTIELYKTTAWAWTEICWKHSQDKKQKTLISSRVKYVSHSYIHTYTTQQNIHTYATIQDLNEMKMMLNFFFSLFSTFSRTLKA